MVITRAIKYELGEKRVSNNISLDSYGAIQGDIAETT